MIGDRDFALTVQMANVDGQTEQRMIDSLSQFLKASHRIDEHPRLRLEGEAYVLFHRVVTEPSAAVQQTVPQDCFSGLIQRRARPETDGVGAQLLSNVNGLAKEIESF